MKNVHYRNLKKCQVSGMSEMQMWVFLVALIFILPTKTCANLTLQPLQPSSCTPGSHITSATRLPSHIVSLSQPTVKDSNCGQVLLTPPKRYMSTSYAQNVPSSPSIRPLRAIDQYEDHFLCRRDCTPRICKHVYSN